MEITLGLIGCGYWGPNLLRNFQVLPGCRVKAVCDLDRSRLNFVQTLHPGLAALSDAGKIIGDGEIDAVVIATPLATHYELACASLRAGKHTFIEKPMAMSEQQCRQLIDLAKSKSLTLMVGHTFLYAQAVRKVKQIIDSGEIGEVLLISSRRLNLGLFQKDINVAWDLAPHDISIILYLIGEDPSSLNCQGKAHITKQVEDVTTLSLNFHNGLFAIVQSSWIDPKKVREATIVGSKKMIVYDDVEPLEKIKVYDKRVEVPPHYSTFAEFQYSYHYGDAYSPYIQHIEPLREECQDFLQCIRTGKIPDSSGWVGLRVVRILEAATLSLAANGARVDIPGVELGTWSYSEKAV